MAAEPPASTHFDPSGNPRMVDVSAKQATDRVATASGVITMAPETADAIRTGSARKGDVLAVAQIAAIQATKLTQQLIPLCHAIPIDAVNVAFDWVAPASQTEKAPRPEQLRCNVTVRTTGKTGVEMEAMTAVSVACLTVYDMLKSIDRAMIIGPVLLLAKSGGKSGDFRRTPPNENR